MDLKALSTAVSEQAAFRRRQRLQPVGGAGDKIFPPTYLGGKHVFEKRRVNGEDCWTVLLDSVQSSSNRAEEALLQLVREKKIDLPYFSVDFRNSDVPEIGEITSLDAPHRIFDAIFRDSAVDGVPFLQSDVGKKLQLATMADASAVFELSPNALLLGAWNSTGQGGGLGAKFPRCFVSEIIGVGVATRGEKDGDAIPAGQRPGSRIDPLGILNAVPVYQKGKGGDWESTEAKGYKKVKPSAINHGNIPPTVTDVGATIDYAEHMVVLSFAALRRLRFGGDERDDAARSVLAALGLVAHLAQAKQGYALRSRCDLVCDGVAPIELVRFDGSTEVVSMNLAEAIALYGEAIAAARKVGFTLSTQPLHLTPQEKLVYLVRESRDLALAGKGTDAEEAPASAGA